MGTRGDGIRQVAPDAGDVASRDGAEYRARRRNGSVNIASAAHGPTQATVQPEGAHRLTSRPATRLHGQRPCRAPGAAASSRRSRGDRSRIGAQPPAVTAPGSRHGPPRPGARPSRSSSAGSRSRPQPVDRRDWPRVLREPATQLDDGRVYDRDLGALSSELRSLLEAFRRLPVVGSPGSGRSTTSSHGESAASVVATVPDTHRHGSVISRRSVRMSRS